MKSEVPSTAGEASDISPRSFCAISAYSPQARSTIVVPSSSTKYVVHID